MAKNIMAIEEIEMVSNNPAKSLSSLAFKDFKDNKKIKQIKINK
jgi:hypothetical protein